MKNIKIIYRDKTEVTYAHQGRPGGSWSKSVRYEGNFVIIKDEWGKEIAIPSDLIKEVQVEELRY